MEPQGAAGRKRDEHEQGPAGPRTRRTEKPRGLALILRTPAHFLEKLVLLGVRPPERANPKEQPFEPEHHEEGQEEYHCA